MSTQTTDLFWDRVIKLIKAHKISREKFAAYIGISYNTLKSWILHNRIPDAYTTYYIAVSLGVTMEYLVEGSDGKASEQREQEAFARKTAAAEIRKMTKKIRECVKIIG